MASCFGVLILLRYKISIIVKLEGHMKRQLISRISFFKKTLSSGTFQNYSLICLRWPEPIYMRKGYVFRVAFLQKERFSQDLIFTHVFKKIEIAMR